MEAMMDIQNLQTFLAVAKLGSFTKAAEQNFISPTAVMKQINKLESELDCTLLERSSAGIRLKPEGEVFLTYAQQLIELSHEAYLACHKATNQVFTLRLGTSLLHPSRPFLSIWNRIKDKLPQYSLTIVQLPSDLVTQNREYEALGKTCDILIGTFDQATTHTLVDAVPLGSYRFSIAVRSDNPLAEKDLLAIKDLENQHLLMVPKGISHKNDLLRAQMEKELAHCQILETPGRYSLDTFNAAIDKKCCPHQPDAVGRHPSGPGQHPLGDGYHRRLRHLSRQRCTVSGQRISIDHPLPAPHANGRIRSGYTCRRKSLTAD